MEIKKLCPVCKDYIWDGSKLKEKYGKDTSCDPCAESWELSFHPAGRTLLEAGTLLSDVVTEKEIGTNARDFPFFPVLVKFIDAHSSLSVQVHPTDDYALTNENSFGKTEMWYVVEAEEDAGLYLGFNRHVSAEEYERAIKENTLTDLLRFFPVKAGECYFIPSGTLHAIGAGCLICEIQQNSNLTYRVYDYGRVDKNGCPRDLHVDKAMLVTNRVPYKVNSLSGSTLGISKYFNVQKIEVDSSLSLNATAKSFHCITCMHGEGSINGQSIKQGDSYFVPAGYGSYMLEGNMTAILTDVRRYYLGIDLGEVFIKGGIVDDEGTIILRDKVTTEREKGADAVVQNIVTLCRRLMERANVATADITGVKTAVSGSDDLNLANTRFQKSLDFQ